MNVHESSKNPETLVDGAKNPEEKGLTGEAMERYSEVFRGKYEDGDNLENEGWIWDAVVTSRTLDPGEAASDDQLVEQMKKGSEEEGTSRLALYQAIDRVDAVVGERRAKQDPSIAAKGWLFREIDTIVEKAGKEGEESRLGRVQGLISEVMSQKIDTYKKITEGDAELDALGPVDEIEAAMYLTIGTMLRNKGIVDLGFQRHDAWMKKQPGTGIAEDSEGATREGELGENGGGAGEIVNLGEEAGGEGFSWEDFDRKLQETINGEETWDQVQGKIDRFVSDGLVEERKDDETGEIRYVMKDTRTLARLLKGGAEYYSEIRVGRKPESDFIVTMAALRRVEMSLPEEQRVELNEILGERHVLVEPFVAEPPAIVEVEDPEKELIKRQGEMAIRGQYLNALVKSARSMTPEQRNSLGITDDLLQVYEDEVNFCKSSVESLQERGVWKISDDSEIRQEFTRRGLGMVAKINNNPSEAKLELERMRQEYEALADLELTEENVKLVGFFRDDQSELRLINLIGPQEYSALIAQVEGRYTDAAALSQAIDQKVESMRSGNVELKDTIMLSLLERQLAKKLQASGIGIDLKAPTSIEEGARRYQALAKNMSANAEPKPELIVEKYLLKDWVLAMPVEMRAAYGKEIEKLVIEVQKSADGVSDLAKNADNIHERLFDADRTVFEKAREVINKDVLTKAVEGVKRETLPSREQANRQVVEILSHEQRAAMGNEKSKRWLAKNVLKYGGIGVAGVGVSVAVYGVALLWWYYMLYEAAMKGLKDGLSENGIRG